MLLATALLSSAKLPVIVNLTRSRLAHAYAIVEAQLRRWGIEFTETRSGVFVWARLLKPMMDSEGQLDGHGLVEVKENGQAKMNEQADADELAKTSWVWELQQIERLRDAGVLVSPGRAFHIAAWPREEGWVRITFAVEEGQLREGLRRIEVCLKLGKGNREADELDGEGKREAMEKDE